MHRFASPHGLSREELESVKQQIAKLVPHLARHQMFELGDVLFEAARKRRGERYDDEHHFSVRV